MIRVDYNKIIITWYPMAEDAELSFGGIKPVKEDYKNNLVSYSQGAIYVMDPLGVFYNDDYEPILTYNENITHRIEKIKNFLIIQTPLSKGFNHREKKIISQSERIVIKNIHAWTGVYATLYKTNRRLIIIYDPPKGLHARPVYEMANALRDNRLRKAKRKIAVSLPIHLVKGYTTGWFKSASLWITCENAGYIVNIRPCNHQLLESLPKERS